ncbi:MAG: hypothetical protein EOO02_00615 [Chitinophagaceae bacterium]|nr:MAG: hypothetical protein EOO02_00615 [Chitinophagaceae bacterium]
MKKLFISILALLYLAVATGVEMNIHYCMGEIASVEYGAPENGACSKCGMESKKGCCEDESKLLKLDDSHQLAKAGFNFQAPVVVPPVQEYQYQAVSLTGIDHKLPLVNAPPGPDVPLYISNCVYRI